MELDLQRELAVKQEKDKQLAKEEEIVRFDEPNLSAKT